MQSELNELQDRYDDLLLAMTARDLTTDEANELLAIERRIEQIMFPVPKREDFDDAEWDVACSEYETGRKAYDDAKYS